MNPKEKALELCQKFGYVTIYSDDNNGITLSLKTAKKSAIICVDEFLKVEPLVIIEIDDVEYSWEEYWLKVKDEINKL